MRETLCWSERTLCSNLQPTTTNFPSSPSRQPPTPPTLPPSLGQTRPRVHLPCPNLSLTFSWMSTIQWSPYHDNRNPTLPLLEAHHSSSSANPYIIITTAEGVCLVHDLRCASASVHAVSGQMTARRCFLLGHNASTPCGSRMVPSPRARWKETDPERQSYFFNKENPAMKEVYFQHRSFHDVRTDIVYFQSHQTSQDDFDSPVKLKCTVCYLLQGCYFQKGTMSQKLMGQRGSFSITQSDNNWS